MSEPIKMNEPDNSPLTEDEEELAKDAFVECHIEELLDLDESWGEEDARQDAHEEWAKMTNQQKRDFL